MDTPERERLDAIVAKIRLGMESLDVELDELDPPLTFEQLRALADLLQRGGNNDFDEID